MEEIFISAGQGDDYTTGSLLDWFFIRLLVLYSLLDFAYFKKNYRLFAADLSKQKVLDADSRAIQQIIFTGKTSQAAIIYYIYEKAKEAILQFSKGTTKVL